MELMELNESENRAVSPVIGVILMVAITVILAAVVGGMVMEMTEGVGNTAPQLSADHTDASAEYDSTTTGTYEFSVLAHTTGDSIPLNQARIIIRDADNAVVGEWAGGSWSSSPDGFAWTGALNGGALATDGEFSAGDTITFSVSVDTAAAGYAASALDDGEYTVHVVDTNSDSTAVEEPATVS